MITKEELKEYAKIKNLNLGQAEKDYFQCLLLFVLFLNTGKSLVFKGGTALNKCFGLNRFSEDLDFTATEKIETDKLFYGLKRFRLNEEITQKEHKNNLKIVIRIQGPLYTKLRTSLCTISIDISLREKIILTPTIKTIGRLLEEIPMFDVVVMNEEEILAEKIRAIMTRSKARDLYDIWFLIHKGIKIDQNLVNEKLKVYNGKLDVKIFKKRIDEIERIWVTELNQLIEKVPHFNVVCKDILKKFN